MVKKLSTLSDMFQQSLIEHRKETVRIFNDITSRVYETWDYRNIDAYRGAVLGLEKQRVRERKKVSKSGVKKREGLNYQEATEIWKERESGEAISDYGYEFRLRKGVKSGEIKTFKRGKRLRLDRRSFETYMAGFKGRNKSVGTYEEFTKLVEKGMETDKALNKLNITGKTRGAYAGAYSRANQ